MSGNTVIVTDASFEDDVLRADRPVIVDFWAEWCMPWRLDEIRVDAELGAWAAHAVLPVPGGAS